MPRAGFTLLEMSIVILVLGILSALAMPMFINSAGQATMTEASGAVASALDYARVASLTTGRAHRVTFDIAAETVRVEEQQTPSLEAVRAAAGSLAATTVEAARTWRTVSHPVDKSLYVLDLDARYGAHAVIHTAAFGGDGIIVFSFPGKPDSAGNVVVRVGALQRTISVNQISGQVSVQ